MMVTAEQFYAWIGAHMLVFSRIAAFMALAPLFSMGSVPRRIKLVYSLVLTMALTPVVQPGSDVDPASMGVVIPIMQQILVGVMLALAVQMVFAAIVFGGNLIGMQMGLGFAQMMDPQSGVSVPVISQFYNLVALLVFLSLDGHLALIKLLSTSFDAIAAGGEWPTRNALMELARFGGYIFVGALSVSLPAVVALLMVSIMKGVITRAAPQMNIFSVGFAILIMLGFVIILVTLPTFIDQVAEMFQVGFEMSRSLLGG